MGANAWGSSPLDVNLRVLPGRIRQGRAAGNGGRVTDRGEAAGALNGAPTNSTRRQGQRAGEGGTPPRSPRGRRGGTGGGWAGAVRVLLWGGLHAKHLGNGERHDGRPAGGGGRRQQRAEDRPGREGPNRSGVTRPLVHGPRRRPRLGESRGRRRRWGSREAPRSMSWSRCSPGKPGCWQGNGSRPTGVPPAWLAGPVTRFLSVPGTTGNGYAQPGKRAPSARQPCCGC